MMTREEQANMERSKGTLVIEAGKFYKTRSGEKVRIYAVDGAGTRPVHGFITYTDSGVPDDQCAQWDLCGAYLPGNGDFDEDLVSEWTDPPARAETVRLAVWKNADGLLRIVIADRFSQGIAWSFVGHLTLDQEAK